MLDPKFDVESNGDGPREFPNNNTLITIPQYVSGNFWKFHRPKFDVESNDAGAGDRCGFFIANLLT